MKKEPKIPSSVLQPVHRSKWNLMPGCFVITLSSKLSTTDTTLRLRCTIVALYKYKRRCRKLQEYCHDNPDSIAATGARFIVSDTNTCITAVSAPPFRRVPAFLLWRSAEHCHLGVSTGLCLIQRQSTAKYLQQQSQASDTNLSRNIHTTTVCTFDDVPSLQRTAGQRRPLHRCRSRRRRRR